jgi:hypothetical protein
MHSLGTLTDAGILPRGRVVFVTYSASAMRYSKINEGFNA